MKNFQSLSLSFIVVLIAYQLNAQNFNNLKFGTDYTLDIVTWNTEWFPTNGSATVNHVKNIVEALDAEIIAFQEIDNKNQFQNLINDLDDYNGYYISNDSYQGLAYLYHKNKIQVLDQYEIYTTNWNEFPRSPLIMEFRFEDETYVIINNHLKCCGDGYLDPYDYDDEEGRRYRACKKLDTYIEDNFDNDRVILLGDLNDELTDREQDNVFKTFLDDEEHYLFADMSIAEGSSNSWSYPTWPSHLDHIMISNELFDIFNESASKCEIIKLDDYFSSWNSYENNVSDHRPVGIKLQTREIGIDEISSNQTQIYPNPFTNTFDIISEKNYDFIKVYNSTGKLVYESETNNKINGSAWSPGLYLIHLLNKDEVVSYRKVIKN